MKFLFADGPRDAVCIPVESTWSVLDLVIELSKRLDPSDKGTFWMFESFEPLQAVMISS